jgi:hypothetical protein
MYRSAIPNRNVGYGYDTRKPPAGKGRGLFFWELSLGTMGGRSGYGSMYKKRASFGKLALCLYMVPRDGIEPPTRGFSVSVAIKIIP